jgi:hypothetical protein
MNHPVPLLSRAALAAVLGTLVLAAGPAHANPKALPFSYGVGTQHRGGLEIEQYADIVAVRVARELPDGSAESTVAPRYDLQTELEYGLTDRIELGLYFAFRQDASATTPFLRFRGVKQRVRWRFSDATWPIGVAGYLEVAEFHDEIEFEQKLLLEKRFGPVRAVANLWVEQEWYFITDETKFIYNPTVGATYEVAPWLQVGAEYWARGRFDEAENDDAASGYDGPSGGTRHYAGPTVMVQGGEYWMALGAYVRLDGLGNATAIDDAYGRVWVRLIAGIGL